MASRVAVATRTGKDPKQENHGRGFWIALAAPGMIWLVLLFVVPFYAVLAIAMGQLNRLYETPIAVWNPLHWSSSNVILKSAANPVLAHEFLNYFLDLPNVLNNISFNGYMQPLTGVTPQVLIKEQILPKALTSTVVLQSDFRRGVSELQLPVDADALWQQAWLVVSNGI